MGPRGPQVVRWDVGPKGDPGVMGLQGVKGDPGEKGETPVITVVENTPISYKLNFKTTEQDITTPNLFAPDTEYHVNLSTVKSVLTIPLKSLVLTYQSTSSSAVRIAVAPKDAGTSVSIDMRRTSIYNASTIETQTLDNTTVSSRTVIDEIVYNKSQETHSIKLRQQDPVAKLWSLCEISSFISDSAARTSVRIQWLEYDVEYEVPATE